MRIVFRLSIVVSCFLLLGCGEKGESHPDKGNPRQESKKVRVSPVQATPLQRSIEYVGSLSAHLKVRVATEIGGTIERLFFEKGDRVNRGQILAEISTSSIYLEVQQVEAALGVARSNLKKTEKGSRPEEIRIARAALELSEANLSETEKNFKRIKDLHGFNAVANSEFDSAKRAVDTARASVQSAREQLELAKKGPRKEDREAARARFHQAESTRALAKDRLRKSRLLSPCDGIIAFRKIEEGEVVAAGTVITQVVDNSKMKINLSLAERDIPLLSKDRGYPFTVDAIPGEAFTCRLTFLSPTADPATRSFPLELLVDEPDHRMADGMTVRVAFLFANQKRIIKLPTAWLWEENGQLGVFVVENGKALFRKTRLGSYYEQKVEILTGLNDNDLVITNPAGLRSGDAVQY